MIDDERIQTEEAIKKRQEFERRERTVRRNLIIFTVVFTALAVGIAVFLWNGFHSEKKRFRERGIKAYKGGHYEDCIAHMDSALKEDQWMAEDIDLDCRMYKAASLFHLERYAEAAKLYKQILAGEHDAKDDIWLNSMVSLSEAMQALESNESDLTELIPTLSAAVEAGEHQLGLYLGVACYNAGDEEGMRNAFSDYEQHYGMNTYMAYIMSSMDLSNGNLDRAADEIQKGLTAEDTLYRDLLLYNEVVLTEKRSPNDFATALEKMDMLMKAYPGREDFQKEYDFLYYRVNVNKEALFDEISGISENDQ